MIPKVHAKGSSFSGAARYLLHDKDHATTDDRVSWTSTRNLATQNPHVAWKVMAATAMDQNRLKAEAGIKNTGRKSNKSVLHMSLAWHPDEADGLTKEEMMRAAYGAIKALGAEDRQAMFVSHNDEPQPHVHILINRVSPEDGRMLPSSNEKRNLSKWAQEYETQRGEILCDQRVINNAARDRGEYTRGQPNTPRHIFELEASNDNKPGVEAIKAEQKKRDLALARKARELKERQKQESNKLVAQHRQRREAIKSAAKIATMKARQCVREDFRPVWEARFHESQAALRAFEQREGQLLGRVGNAFRAIDFAALIGGKDRQQAMQNAYNAISSSGGRLEGFKRVQVAADREVERKQKAEEKHAATLARQEWDDKLSRQRATYRDERSSLILKHNLERAASRAEWKTRNDQRRVAYEKNCFHGKSTGPENQTYPSASATPKGSASPTIDSTQTAKMAEQIRKLRDAHRQDDRSHDSERDSDC